MIIRKSAKKALRKMPTALANRFFSAFDKIERYDCEGLDIKRMSGEDGLFRLRIGQYRAIYTQDFELIIVQAGPRGDVYK